jgi:lipoprotein-releasing system permease protein
MTAPAVDTRPFAPFEWLLALRYLRARRREGFISVIAGFSFLGILLGVATLIIVMAVMNGFRKELFNKILGLDGHVVVLKVGSMISRSTTRWPSGCNRCPG